MVICFQFSKYINNNSEQLRDKFVDFKGKKKLTVTTGDETDESQWNEFFNSMIEQIKKTPKRELLIYLHLISQQPE